MGKREQESRARGVDTGSTTIAPQDAVVSREVGNSSDAAVTSGLTQGDPKLQGNQPKAEPYVYRCNCGWSGQLEHLEDGKFCMNCKKQLAGDNEAAEKL